MLLTHSLHKHNDSQDIGLTAAQSLEHLLVKHTNYSPTVQNYQLRVTDQINTDIL